MKCPHCKVAILQMSERNGIEIDYCPDCRGVWLDRGELDKIIEKAQTQQAPQQSMPIASPPPHHHDSSGYYKYKRKKSFLEEIFD